MAVSISPLLNDSAFNGTSKNKTDKKLFLQALPAILGAYKMTNTFRLVHFLGQTAHETGNYFYEEEIASGEKYNGRSDLGNKQPGDGPKFKGRGFVQLTGRHNYTLFQKKTGVDFTSTLDAARKVLQPQYLWSSAGWYFLEQRPKFFGVADQGINNNTILPISKFVNGGTNGLADRQKKTFHFGSLFGQTNQTVSVPVSSPVPSPNTALPVIVNA